jgi:hypothetical protein
VADQLDDYDRHLREPHRKVREDVEKEYAPKIAKLQSALETKTFWANRLDENIRAVTAENKDLKMVSLASCFYPIQSLCAYDVAMPRCRSQDRSHRPVDQRSHQQPR